MGNRNTQAKNALQELFRALECLESPEELELFLADLLTPAELHAIPRRWLAAVALQSGKTIEQVSEELDMAGATIVRVRRALSFGTGGYRHVLARSCPTDRA